MGNLKGTAYRKEVYLWKKKHPILWQIRKFIKWLFHDRIRIDVR